MRDTTYTSDHLSRFIHRIYEIKESRANIITQNDLKAAAKEMGVTDREWVQLQDLFSSHLARAIGYHKYKNWDDAILELDQALTINPFDSKTLFLTSSCYANKYYEEENKNDRELSIKFANKCLEINPLDEKSLQLLSSLKKEERQRKVIERESLKTLIVACSFGAIIFTALAYLSFSDIVVTTIPYTAESVTIKTTEFKPSINFTNADHNNSYLRVTDNIIKIFERKAALVVHGELMESEKVLNGMYIKWKDLNGNVVYAEHFSNQYLQDIKDPNNDNFKLIKFLESEKAIKISDVEIVLN